MRTIGIRRIGFAAWLLLACAAAQAFDLQGHRGARGLAPENTLAAFERALRIGVDTIEFDVVITADGVPVVVHDLTLNPAVVRDEKGEWLSSRPPVRSLTLAELQRFDVGRLDPASRYGQQFADQVASDGERIPALADVLERIKALAAARAGSLPALNIETKLDPRRPDFTPEPAVFVEALLRVIREAGITERVTIQSFDWRTLRHVREAEPKIPTACLTTQGSSNDNVRDGAWTAGLRIADYPSVAAMAKAAGCMIWSPNFNNLQQADVAAAHAIGLKVVPWTANLAADMERLLDWRVDGLITDYPDRLREVMARRNMPLPTALPR
jgi:glycerophosphoryl diester phosphodiesterase